MASPPTRMKPETSREATGISTCGTLRGGWGQRAWKDQSRSLGDPVAVEAQATNREWECITIAGLDRESERLIVAQKRSNARGAKGPY